MYKTKYIYQVMPSEPANDEYTMLKKNYQYFFPKSEIDDLIDEDIPSEISKGTSRQKKNKNKLQ